MRIWWLKAPVHPTWQFTTLCAGIVLGLALSVIDSSWLFASWQWLVTGVLLFLFTWWKHWRWLLAVALLAGLLIGLSRGASDIDARTAYDPLFESVQTIRGTVAEDVDRGKRGEYVARISNVVVRDVAMPAQLWVSYESVQQVKRSDILTLRGTLSDGFGSFAASMHRAEVLKVERPMPGDVALAVRDNFGEKVRLGIDEPSASLGMGYLTGQRRSLPEDLDNALKIAGLTHIVVASGYNLTILVRAMKRLFEKRSRYLTVFLSSLLILGFIAVTGLSPSMSRAGLVAGLSLAAWYFGRKFHPVTLLLFAAALTGLINPSYVWGNLGWQLSFAAFAGVMILAPLGQAYFFGSAKPGWLRQILGETISAQIATAPLLLYSFGAISNVAVIANALVLPLVPLAMLLTFFAGIVGYILPGIVAVVALPAQRLLDYMVFVATKTAGLSWAQTEYQLSLVGLVTSFAVLAAVCVYMWRATGYRLRDSNIIE